MHNSTRPEEESWGAKDGGGVGADKGNADQNIGAEEAGGKEARAEIPRMSNTQQNGELGGSAAKRGSEEIMCAEEKTWSSNPGPSAPDPKHVSLCQDPHFGGSLAL